MSEIVGTANGRPVTDVDVDAIIANAEAGFPGVTVRPVGRPSLGTRPARTVAVRLDPDLDDTLLEYLAETGETASDVMRTALRHFLMPV